ncbi:MAG: hypothetical protein KGY75_08085 [Candidatus Cloacimonetes bacterium]|nr:hypothetical protein [Candidatus Cloacimonadota bacterium]MBS3768060.1 hypothetical protein [Candidatus Cloacimonadota bacterium]
MARTFKYTVNKKPQQLFTILKEKLKGQVDINFVGDENSGKIEGSGFAGDYIITKTDVGTEIEMTITKKPIIIPWGLIETKLNEELGNL